MNLKVLLFLANGFELIEASVFIDVFGWHRSYCNGNIEVITCGLKKEICNLNNIILIVIPYDLDLSLEHPEKIKSYIIKKFEQESGLKLKSNNK